MSECSSSDDLSKDENHAMETRCSRGKNRRHTDVPEACVSNKCPCYKLERPCSRKCRCYNCQNKNDSKPNGIKKNIKLKGCRCGLAKKCKGSDASNKPCWDDVRKSKCPCVASGPNWSELTGGSSWSVPVKLVFSSFLNASLLRLTGPSRLLHGVLAGWRHLVKIFRKVRHRSCISFGHFRWLCCDRHKRH